MGKPGPGIPVVALAVRLADLGVPGDPAASRDEVVRDQPADRDPRRGGTRRRRASRPVSSTPVEYASAQSALVWRAKPASSTPIGVRVAAARVPGDVLLADALDHRSRVDAVVGRDPRDAASRTSARRSRRRPAARAISIVCITTTSIARPRRGRGSGSRRTGTPRRHLPGVRRTASICVAHRRARIAVVEASREHAIG